MSAPTAPTPSGANAILRTLAERSRPRAARTNATTDTSAGRYPVDAGCLRAEVTRLPVDRHSGRWRFHVQVTHLARPGAVIYEEVRLGEHDAGDGTVDSALARHGWWTLDELADAAESEDCDWARPHPTFGLMLDNVDAAARLVALWDASRAISLDLTLQRDYIDACARRHGGRDRYPILGRPTIPTPHDWNAT
jgi:hypothetical protein